MVRSQEAFRISSRRWPGELDATMPDATVPVTAPVARPKPKTFADQDVTDECLYLIGRPKAKHFLRFVRHHAVEAPSEEALLEQWRAAQAHVRTLEAQEAGFADDPVITRLEASPKYEPLLSEFLEDPLVRNGFHTVPTEVAFVELDRLVVHQKHIDVTFVRRLQKQLGPSPSDEDVFRTCLPSDPPQPPAKWGRLDDDGYVFVSPSNDLRFLGALPLTPDHVQGYPHPGDLVGVVGLTVGFGSNFLNAIHCEDRLVLNNGSHRAYALRALGFKHAPCVVRHVATRDELDLVASGELKREPDLYLRGRRPSMLKDYFDPKLRTVMRVQRMVRQVRVKFSVSEHYVPAV